MSMSLKSMALGVAEAVSFLSLRGKPRSLNSLIVKLARLREDILTHCSGTDRVRLLSPVPREYGSNTRALSPRVLYGCAGVTNNCVLMGITEVV